MVKIARTRQAAGTFTVKGIPGKSASTRAEAVSLALTHALRASRAKEIGAEFTVHEWEEPIVRVTSEDAGARIERL